MLPAIVAGFFVFILHFILMKLSLQDFDRFDGDAFTVPYAWVKNGKQPGPTVTVLGGVHGNETVGVQIVHDLLQEEVQKGTLQLALGNLSAITAGKRFIDKDLNRSFGHPVAGVRESVRANHLKALLGQTDLLLDVHSTMKPSHPFLAIPDVEHLHHPFMSLVASLGIPTIVTGKGLFPPDGEPIYADTFVEASGGFSVTIEAGWSEDPKIMEVKKGISRALAELGILDMPKLLQESDGSHTEGVVDSKEVVSLQIWDAYWNVLADPGFSFIQDWGNFQQLSEGTVFASTADGNLFVPEDSIILFPKSHLVAGQEACIIAKKFLVDGV